MARGEERERKEEKRARDFLSVCNPRRVDGTRPRGPKHTRQIFVCAHSAPGKHSYHSFIVYTRINYLTREKKFERERGKKEELRRRRKVISIYLTTSSVSG
jgi:hypothetical protein